MFTLLKNRLSAEDIKLLQDCWDPNSADIKRLPRNLNDTNPTEAIWLKPSDPAWQLISALVKELCPNERVFVCAYERQYTPIPIHVDPGNCKYSMILPMTEDSRCETLIWKKSFGTKEEFESWTHDWTLGANPNLINYKHSEKYDLSNVWNRSKGLVIGDYYELEDVFTYHVGDVALFMSKQMHCSANWKKYSDLPYKDFVAVHIW
jgi:hypothetical protein